MLAMRLFLMVVTAGLVCGLSGCVSVRAPERVEIHTGRPEPVDSSRLPETATYEECRSEL